jgi:hypothetical protein
MTTDECNVIVGELKIKIESARAAIAEIDARRSAIAFDAIAQGDGESKKALAKAHADRAARQSEIADLEFALAQAKRHIVEAGNAEAAAAAQARAELAAPIVARLAARGALMDSAIRAYREHYVAIDADLTELDRLGAPIPSRQLVAVNLRRAGDAALMGLDEHSRPIPPNQRHSFESLLRGWAQPGINWINNRLNKSADAA